MTVEDCKMPTQSQLTKKVMDINRLINHKFTNEELNEKLRKQGSLDSKTTFFKRVDIEKKLKLAQEIGDNDEVERLQRELANHAPRLAFGSNAKPRAEKLSEHERLAQLNLRNQKLNYENVRRAQLEERKASRKAAAAAARGDSTAINPFLRVKTLAKTHHDVNGSTPKAEDNHSPSVTPASGTPKANTPGGTPSSSQNKQSQGGAKIRHRNMDDENIAALDLDIDIEI